MTPSDCRGLTTIGRLAIHSRQTPVAAMRGQMAAGAYGVIVPDAEMVPVFRPGDIVIVNPNLPPTEGSDVLLIGTGADGHEVMVRTLESIGRKGWLATSWNPATRESFPRTLWKA